MKKRIISLLLVLALLAGSVPAVFAAGHGMTDIVGHWAEEDIAWAIREGLFNGTSATTFDPNSTMTRGMFVTVLGRCAGIDPDEYDDWYIPVLFTDVNPEFYYAPYINWAARHGITSGTGGNTFSPDEPITREQMATFLFRYAYCYGYVFEPIREDVAPWFDDEDRISLWAIDAVEMMREVGILNGRTNADGGFDFDPQSLAVRSEGAAVFRRLSTALAPDESFSFEEPQELILRKPDTGNLMPGDSFTMEYTLVPTWPTNSTVIWVSSDPKVLSVDNNGTVTCRALGHAEIYAYACNGVHDSVAIEVGGYLGYKGESYKSKCMNLFGEVVDNPRRPYGDDAPKSVYLENMTRVTVKVWDFKKGIGSEKITKNLSFDVHKNLAATVKQAFKEIYECEEKYPIEYVVTYWHEGVNSEHNPGLAIDINVDSNPYVDPYGKVLVGKKFDPENDPYSIPIGGEVQTILEKYGFTRGIYWRSGYKDYMHFSFFGT